MAETKKTELQEALQALIDYGYLDLRERKEIHYPIHYSNIFASDIVELIVQDNRALNGLKRAGVFNVNDLITNWDRLDKVRNIGKKSLSVIRNTFMNYYYCSLDTEGKAKFLAEVIRLNTGSVDVEAV